MVDNVAITPGTGVTVATDDIAGVQVQRVKVTWGADGVMNDANATTPLPIALVGGNTNGQGTMANSAPVVIASDQSAINVANTGTFATQALQKPSATANGTTSSRINAAASTNATSLKASAGQVYSVDVFNVAAYDVFLKFYNKASAPTVGTDTPVWTIPIKAGAGYSNVFMLGKAFSTGIAYAITKLQADSDTTAVAALDVTGTMDWI